MAIKYFLYSDEQITEKNKIMEKSGKRFCPGVVTVNGKRQKFTQISDVPSIPRFVDTKIVTKGELSKITYKEPYYETMKGN